ncbi:MAG: DNA translocase FtsK [Terriglobales bacterium]|jgi:S-DNA-T family DNA segregation ATPase FtsK/SpoIIIE
MKLFSAAFTPTGRKRLNELVGLLLFAGALLLLLALASYSPHDPSLNTAAPSSDSRTPHNWIGMAGSYSADVLLQVLGISAFLLPLFLLLLAIRWFWSRKTESPVAKLAGAVMMLVFIPALLALAPFHWHWLQTIPMEGLVGRIAADALIHYFNLVGAYIVAATLTAVALYLSTAFSFTAMRPWLATHCGFLFALWNRFQDWRRARAQAKAKKDLEKKRAAQTLVTTRLAPDPSVIPMRATSARESLVANPVPSGPVRMKTGIEREAEIEDESADVMASFPPAQREHDLSTEDVQVTARADSERRAKTTLPKIAGAYKMPSSALLARPDEQNAINEEELKTLAEVLTKKYAEFDVHGQVVQINPGPVVTTFEFKPEAGIKYSRVTGLTDDLCLALRAEKILIERMPGKSTVGVQVPNREREVIRLREIVESSEFVSGKSKLTLALGKDINGGMMVADLATMPHLLIAGSTGSGKSVALNAMLMSLLYKSTPDEIRLILVDPKRLELGVYESLPHLFTPIITEAKLAANALRNAVREMERRLKLLAEKGVRNIDQYNKLFDERTPGLFDEQSEESRLPFIVIVIDELADLMMLDQSNVEESITRLAQMARAVGIHLVLATQRPSVDVITGLIKANFPARISFRVATKVDSRTILDGNGAEALLGRGDMLYLPAGSGRLVRLHAPFVTEKEIAAVVDFWRHQGNAQYVEGFLDAPREEGTRAEATGGEGTDTDSGDDDLYQDAVRLVIEFGKASTSLLQRRLRIGYGRAAHLIDLMEQDGIVGAADGPKPREVLKRPDWLTEVYEALR